jgi:hypothetical protein
LRNRGLPRWWYETLDAVLSLYLVVRFDDARFQLTEFWNCQLDPARPACYRGRRD